MHAPSKSTASTASKIAGLALNPRRLPGNCRGLPNNPRNGCGSFLSGSVKLFNAPVICRNISTNYPKAPASWREDSANYRSGRVNFLKGPANLPDAPAICRKDLANCLKSPVN